MNLSAYLDHVEFERVIPAQHTDSHFMRVEGDRHGLKITKVYDMEPTLKAAEFIRNINRETNGFAPDRTMRHVGCIPIWVAVHILKASMGDPILESKMVKNYLRVNSKFSTVDNARSF